MARYSEAQNRATQKYQKVHYCRVSICIPKELEDAVNKKGEECGSRNSYIVELIKKDLGLD